MVSSKSHGGRSDAGPATNLVTGPPSWWDKRLAGILAWLIAWLLRSINKRTLDQKIDILEITIQKVRARLEIPDND